MASEVQMIGYELIKTGSLASFRIVEEEVLAAPDEAEFGMRLLLRFVSEDGEDDQDEDDVAGLSRDYDPMTKIFREVIARTLKSVAKASSV
jgi:hypothetical protein